ncbi:hypothetical protein B4U80_14471, partial [Leptotrombidium deliense]
NVGPVVDFNVHFDPEAAYITLKNANCPITIIPWETEEYDELAQIKTKRGIFFKRITQILSDNRDRNTTEKGFTVGDLLLTTAFFYPEAIKRTQVWPATVELHGQFTRGELIPDKRLLFKTGVTFITRMSKNIVISKFKEL